MANDIKILWDNEKFEGDISFDNGDLVREEGLETAVYMSLFTDRRASEEDILPDPSNDDLKGWWGDQTTDFPDDQIGSKLWLLSRAKTESDTPARAEGYALEALEWLVEDGVSIRNEVTATRVDRGDRSAVLRLEIKIYHTFDQVSTFTFDDVWNAQFAGS